MQCNVGKNIRLVLGILIVLWGLLYQNWWGLIGLVLLITAFVSWCPLYAVLGIKTCEHKENQTEKEEASVDSGVGQPSTEERDKGTTNKGEESVNKSEDSSQFGGEEESVRSNEEEKVG